MIYFLKNDDAVTPVLGVILMVLLTVVLAGAVAATVVSNSSVSSLSSSTPVAMIEVEDAVGGVPNTVQYKENYVTLEHRGGDSLNLDSTYIVLSGEGSSYVGKVGHGGFKAYGHVTAKYYDLTPEGSCITYLHNNPSIDDGLWSVGEVLVLNGDDSINGTDASTVHVSVDGYSDTSNNYGFRDATTVNVKIFDSLTDRIICEDIVTVKLAE